MVTGIPAAQRTQEVELSLQLKWIQIQFIRKIFSSWRLNSLGSLCHFRFSRVGVGGSKCSRPIFLLQYLRRPWIICSGCGRRTRWGRRSTEVDPGCLTSSQAQRLLWTSLRAPGFRIYFFPVRRNISIFSCQENSLEILLLRRMWTVSSVRAYSAFSRRSQAEPTDQVYSAGADIFTSVWNKQMKQCNVTNRPSAHIFGPFEDKSTFQLLQKPSIRIFNESIPKPYNTSVSQ